jgi:hypothetical protein
MDEAGAKTAEAAVDHLTRRFLRAQLSPKDRLVLVDFLKARLGGDAIQPGDRVEPALRELLYLVLSTPEYQLG